MAIIEHEQTELACIKKWYKVEQNIRLDISLRDIMASYLYNMEGFYQQACSYAASDTRNGSTAMIHRVLVGPIKILTQRYVDFFNQTYDLHYATNRQLVKQLKTQDQRFPYSGPIQSDDDYEPVDYYM
jgi:hypothetical protein